MKTNIQAFISKAPKVSLCADIWTKKGMSSSYLGVTAHFFTQHDHMRHRVTLAVRRLHHPHTAKTIRDIIDEVLTEWNTPLREVRTIITGNASNMILKRMQTLVAKVNKSSKATEMLLSRAHKKLVGNCPTRWSSTYLMIKRLLDVRIPLTSVLEELEWDNLAISDWKVLENIQKLMNPFALYTGVFPQVGVVVALVEEREVGVPDMVVVFGVEDHTSGEGMVGCVSVLCVKFCV